MPYQKPHTWDAAVDGIGCSEHDQIASAPFLEDKATRLSRTWLLDLSFLMLLDLIRLLLQS